MSRLHAPTKLPSVEQAEAHVFFEGWWNGIAVGFVIGAGLVTALISSGVLS
jgi:hypothetical protein